MALLVFITWPGAAENTAEAQQRVVSGGECTPRQGTARSPVEKACVQTTLQAPYKLHTHFILRTKLLFLSNRKEPCSLWKTARTSKYSKMLSKSAYTSSSISSAVRITARKMNKNQTFLLPAKWKGFPASGRTWVNRVSVSLLLGKMFLVS